MTVDPTHRNDETFLDGVTPVQELTLRVVRPDANSLSPRLGRPSKVAPVVSGESPSGDSASVGNDVVS